MKKLMLLFLFTLCVQTSLISQETISHINLKVQMLSDQVYVFEETERYRVNLVALTGSDGIILLDTGFKMYANDLVDTLKSLHFGSVKFIINSHIDRDHVETNYFFGTDITIIGYKNCDHFVKTGGTRSITFENNYAFEFNDLDVRCTAYPGGHTSCDIIVYVPKLKLAYLGDIYFSESFPRVDIESGSNAQVLLTHLKTIYSTLPNDTRLIPGHGRVTTMDEFKLYIDMIESTMKIIKAEMDKGKNLKEIQDADVLQGWNEWGTYFTMINKNSWINNVYSSYSGQ
ncbi:MBL fold metallo-hydrolase [candidate division KSB1 bacterium]|nr:MBL fold metallo-hydrolase [candidate division KSB1 bacterium]